MYLIVGLGNPTRQYEGTRHNVGFETIDKISAAFGIPVNTNKHKALIGKGIIGFEKAIIAKPLTYMNLSGEAVREITDFYKIPPENVIVIFDDVSLDVGQLRIRTKGSAGGHNGIKSIIAHLGSQDFPRIKVGVGEKPSGWDLADYVLGKYSAEDRKRVDEAQDEAVKAVALMVNGEVNKAMNQFNTKKK